MKRFLTILIALAASLGAHAQYSRFDSQNTTTQAQGGNLLPVYAIPGASVSFYACSTNLATSCTTPAVTYNGAGGACSSGAQVNPQGSLACVSTADTQGNFGAWFVPGTYAYTLTSQGASYGPFVFTAGGGSSTSLNIPGSSALTGAVVLACGTGLSCSQTGQTITIGAATAFTINSFTGCAGTLELGQAVTNPTCVATYSVTPTSGNITNTDGISSPTAITPANPTSTVISGSFSHSTTATTTFTLTAVGSSTQVATQAYSWKPRIFGGVGASGATSSVTASGTTAVLSTGAVLTSIQLGAETIGQTLGSYTPSGQNVYVLLTGGSHTFTDNCTGFPFAFNSPTAVAFVNAQGATVSMWLYQSTNSLTYTSGCAFTPKVAS